MRTTAAAVVGRMGEILLLLLPHRKKLLLQRLVRCNSLTALVSNWIWTARGRDPIDAAEREREGHRMTSVRGLPPTRHGSLPERLHLPVEGTVLAHREMIDTPSEFIDRESMK